MAAMPSPSATTMAAKLQKRDGGGLSLPEDIILEVLLRLPAKALCRFQCASRSWRALIFDSAFVAALRSRATGRLIVALFGNELRLLDKGGNVLMVFDVRDCRELLMPTRLKRILVYRGQLGDMITDLVSGRDFSIVGTIDPPPPLWDSPVISDYSVGRAIGGDYKVLRLTTSSSFCRHPGLCWCHVATIMDGGAEPTWRRKPWGPFHSSTKFSCGDKATVNGVLYMLINTNSESHGRKSIAAFDLESEKWRLRKIKGPLLGHKNKDDKWRITLTDLKGTLCMVCNVQYLADLVGHYADIWLLKDRISCVWVKEYKIKMPAERLLLFTRPLDVLTDGKLLLLNRFRKEGTTNLHRYILQLYDSSTKAFTEFMEMAPGFNGEMAFYTGNLQD